MISKDKQYKTRNGNEVRIYATDGVSPYYIHGAIKSKIGWSPCSWTTTGQHVSDKETDDDLIEVKPEKWFPIMVASHNVPFVHTLSFFNTKEEALNYHSQLYGYAVDAYLFKE